MSCDVGEVTESLENEQSYPQYNEQSSYSNLSVTSPTSQLILQPFRRFTYVTAHSSTLPLLHPRHSSFSNPSFASPTSKALHLIHLASRPCCYQTHRQGQRSRMLASPTFPSLYLRHSSFSNPSVASPTSRFIRQPFFRFSYVTSSSLNSSDEPRMLARPVLHKLMTTCNSLTI